jgi:hypothetical protein
MGRRAVGRSMRGTALAACALMVGLALLPSCTPEEDFAFFYSKEFGSSMGAFTTWWKAEHSAAIGVSARTMEGLWAMGQGLDGSTAKQGYWDLSTDFCSNSRDTAAHFDFKAPCVRHDFAWRNLKKMDARHHVHRFNIHVKRVSTTKQFHEDMDGHCDGRHWAIRQACFTTSDIYFQAVMAAA